MYKLYKKKPENFALAWIGIYCLVQSLANGISARIGIPKSANAVLALIQSAYMLWWLHKNGIMKEFQLNKPTQPAKRMLFYIPLVLISTRGLWSGFRMNLTPVSLYFHIVLMIGVGFLEELIFRGFLFEAMAKDNMKTAIVVSSVTFGLGHIINLFNGRGMDLTAVIIQIVIAVVIGFLMVMVYLRSGSIIPCMITHAAINISSAFLNKQNTSLQEELLLHGIMVVIIIAYLLVLSKTAPVQRKA